MGVRVNEGAEAFGEVGTILERLELRLGERIVVRDVGPGMRRRDAQIGQEQRHRLGGHRAAPIGVDGQLARKVPLSRAARRDESLGEGRRFAMGDRPF